MRRGPDSPHQDDDTCGALQGAEHRRRQTVTDLASGRMQRIIASSNRAAETLGLLSIVAALRRPNGSEP